jgi:excisionase family DNA binding protein
MMKSDAMSIEHAPKTEGAGRTFHSIPQVAEHLQVSDKTIRRWIKSGDLITHRFGHQWRISRTDLENFIKMRREV